MQIPISVSSGGFGQIEARIQIAFPEVSTDRRSHGSTTPDTSQTQATKSLPAAQEDVASFDTPGAGQAAGKEGTGYGRMMR